MLFSSPAPALARRAGSFLGSSSDSLLPSRSLGARFIAHQRAGGRRLQGISQGEQRFSPAFRRRKFLGCPPENLRCEKSFRVPRIQCNWGLMPFEPTVRVTNLRQIQQNVDGFLGGQEVDASGASQAGLAQIIPAPLASSKDCRCSASVRVLFSGVFPKTSRTRAS